MNPTLRNLYDRCIEVGSCQLWQQAVNTRGMPIISLSAMATGQSVRRVAWELTNGPIPPQRFIYPTCGQVNCISCLKCGTKSQYMMHASKRGVYSTPAICAAKARGARAGSRHTMDTARAIRVARSNGALLREIAAEHGISMDMASKIARGLVWREAALNCSVFHQG